MAEAYLPGPRPNAGRVLTWLVTVAFTLVLASLKPFVRIWIDPMDRQRQVAVVVIPRGGRIVAVCRVLAVATVYGVVGGALLALRPGIIAVIATVAPLIVGLVVMVTLESVSRSSYEGYIPRSGPRVPGADVHIVMAASSVTGGMLAARAYLLRHHDNQRVTIRARDNESVKLYQALGLRVVEPGSGRMTGIIGRP